MTVPLALGPLYAGFVLAPSQPIGIVGLGSSTMNAGDQWYEDRWFTKLIKHYGTTAEVSPLALPPNTNPGFHGYNGGQGGTTADNYLTQARVDAIRAIQPVTVFHVVGSNDYASNVHPNDYYTRMSHSLNRIDSVMSRPYVNILIHAHLRGGRYAYSFTQYRDVLIRLARERSNCHFIDVGAPFYGAGVPRQDSFDLLSSDNVHLTRAGHDFFFRVVAEDTK